MSDETPLVDFSAACNASRGGWNEAMGVRFVRVTLDEVVVELEIGPHHLQPQGIVHGGVYSGVIESIASVGAAMNAMARGQTVVGLENHTSFLRAVREGTVVGTARPLTRGRRTQVWEATIADAAGRTLATGRVRLLSLEGGSILAGEAVGAKTEP